jgi:hypothetical protein
LLSGTRLSSSSGSGETEERVIASRARVAGGGRAGVVWVVGRGRCRVLRFLCSARSVTSASWIGWWWAEGSYRGEGMQKSCKCRCGCLAAGLWRRGWLQM